MAKPRISIIVPVYNSERYLPACLDSLVSQSFDDIEIICINDGSTDGSLSVLESYAKRDQRIRIISQKNGGVSEARNRGIEESTGEYVLFVDSDDMLLQTACEELIAVAKGDGSDIVCFGGKTFPTLGWADDSFAKRRHTYPQGKSVEALLYEAGSTPLMCNKMYRNELLRSSGVRFNKELTLGEDNAFQFCIFPHANVVSYTESVLYFYRMHGASAIASNKNDAGVRIKKHIKVVQYVCSQWHSAGFMPLHGKELMGWLIGFLYNDFIESPYETRKEIALALTELISSCFAPSVVDGLGDEQWYRLRQTTEIALVKHDSPLVSFVVKHATVDYLDSSELQSIVCQNEPNIEVLLVPDETCDAADLEQAREADGSFIKGDVRCRIVGIFSPSDLCEQCKGKWIIVTSASCSYELSTVAQLIDHLDVLGKIDKYGAGKAPVLGRGEYVRGTDACEADVVVFTDAHACIRMEDEFFGNTPSVEKPLSSCGLYSHVDLATRLVSVTGMTTANKLYSKRFVSQYASKNNGKDEDLGFFLALAVEEAEAILIFRMPLLSYGAPFVRPTHDGSLSEAIQSFGTLGMARGRSLVLAAADERVRKDRLSALFYYYMGVLDSVSDYQVFEQIFALYQNGLKGLVEETGLSPEFAEQDDVLLSDALLSQSSQSYFNLKMACNIKKMTMLNKTTMKQLGEEHAANARLNDDIREFYQSISYRVGRGVTLPLRKIVYALKAMKDRG